MPPVLDPMTFDDLTAIYRMEKKTATLPAVRRDLYPAMASLLSALKTEYDRQLSMDPDSLVCEGANQRRKKGNHLSKEIVELRMQKICALALRSAMGAQNSIESLTSEEKEYYNDVLNISQKQENILNRIGGRKKFETSEIDREIPEHRYQTPAVEDIPPAPVKTEEEPKAEDIPFSDESYLSEMMEEEDQEIPPDILDSVPPAKDVKSEESKDGEFAVIRILEDLPPFSGPDRDYNLSKEDIVRMPKVMADALVGREKAVAIRPTP